MSSKTLLAVFCTTCLTALHNMIFVGEFVSASGLLRDSVLAHFVINFFMIVVGAAIGVKLFRMLLRLNITLSNLIERCFNYVESLANAALNNVADWVASLFARLSEKIRIQIERKKDE